MNPHERYRTPGYFGILLVTDRVMVIKSIDYVYNDYLLVTMVEHTKVSEMFGLKYPHYFGSPCDTVVSIVKRNNIVAIYTLEEE